MHRLLYQNWIAAATRLLSRAPLCLPALILATPHHPDHPPRPRSTQHAHRHRCHNTHKVTSTRMPGSGLAQRRPQRRVPPVLLGQDVGVHQLQQLAVLAGVNHLDLVARGLGQQRRQRVPRAPEDVGRVVKVHGAQALHVVLAQQRKQRLDGLDVHGQRAHVGQVQQRAALPARVDLGHLHAPHALVQDVAAQPLQLLQVARPPVVLLDLDDHQRPALAVVAVDVHLLARQLVGDGRLVDLAIGHHGHAPLGVPHDRVVRALDVPAARAQPAVQEGVPGELRRGLQLAALHQLLPCLVASLASQLLPQLLDLGILVKITLAGLCWRSSWERGSHVCRSYGGGCEFNGVAP
mmetsp:Transcript_27127/g.68978  ORF Transcript_27127/g.68978 Transcript_27127/m.68978 type:complete len:350 (-) Transcript_27127:19-1068(-)